MGIYLMVFNHYGAAFDGLSGKNPQTGCTSTFVRADSSYSWLFLSFHFDGHKLSNLIQVLELKILDEKPDP
jgi:hypothetical protein